MKYTVVLTADYPAIARDILAGEFDVIAHPTEQARSEEEMITLLAEADAAITLLSDPLTRRVLASNPNLRMVANYAVGYNNIDVEAARELHVTITNTPGVLTEATADLTIALILAITRRLIEGDSEVRRTGACIWEPLHLLGTGLQGKRLGIVGMGRIGQALARRAKAFGLSIHYHNRRHVPPKIEAELEATYWESLDQMLARMDIVSVNCPHTPATYHLLSARRLKLMKADAILVNTARGEIIDEGALTKLIEAGAIAGAGLDVFEEEPAVNPRLVRLAKQGKVVLLPHMGSATHEGRVAMGEKVIVNIRAFVDGHKPPDRVLPSML
jgi:glyoxylate reductase